MKPVTYYNADSDGRDFASIRIDTVRRSSEDVTPYLFVRFYARNLRYVSVMALNREQVEDLVKRFTIFLNETEVAQAAPLIVEEG